MADKEKATKTREAGDFAILVSSGVNDAGEQTFTLKGNAKGTSKKNAITNAVSEGGIDLKIGDEVAAVSAKQFVPKTIGLSI